MGNRNLAANKVTTARRERSASAAAAKKPRSRRAAVSEDRIIATATRMFAERGYPAISIRDIATACEVNIPSIYHYFKDKDDLYDRCCEFAFQQAAATLRATLVGPEDSPVRLKRFAIALCDLLLNASDFRRLLQRELLLPRSRRFEALTSNSFTHEYKLLIPAVGEIAGATGARSRAFSIYAMVFGLIVLEPIAEYSGAKAAMLDSPAKLAEFVLSSLFPEIAWKNV